MIAKWMKSISNEAGEEGDACSELLVHTLESLRSLPPASIFYLIEESDKNTSSLWLSLVEKCISFLRSIVFE